MNQAKSQPNKQVSDLSVGDVPLPEVLMTDHVSPESRLPEIDVVHVQRVLSELRKGMAIHGDIMEPVWPSDT
ncbi:hypothetical protein KSF73_05070 [Burkholderiaceae bacterium DAT-1]|nr:hypothetical protein [Burkholderiaceae bacterium DAT-1]